jgi:CubicO group peptidase (beta-lactamase class C family)
MKNKLTVFILLFLGLSNINSLYGKHLTALKDTAINNKIVYESMSKRLDSLLTAFYTNNEFSGSILVAEKGNIIYAKSLGWADIEHNDTLQLNTPMPIASITKQFTGMAIMILKEKGLLNYNDDITKYLPEIQQKGITIKHLLHHTSGLDFNGPSNRAGKTFRYMSKNATLENGIKLLDKKSLLKAYEKGIPKANFYPPGKEFRYSNGGYTLLAAIIERVSGLPYWEFMQKHIFEPLNMTQTFVLRPKVLNEQKIAYSYFSSVFKGIKKCTPYYDRYKPDKYCVVLDGDKHIYSTVLDMLKWDQALYTEKLVSKETLKDAFTSGKLNNGKNTEYGFGWELLYAGADSVIMAHSGGIENYATGFQRQTDQQRTTIILTNAQPSNMFRVWTGMVDILENKPFRPYVLKRKNNFIIKLKRKMFKKKVEIKYTSK